MTHDYRNSDSAELRDRIARHGARVALVVALMTATSVAAFYVTESATHYLGYVEKGLAILVVIMVIVAVLMVLRKRSPAHSGQPGLMESFLNEVARRSVVMSWAVTFVLMVVLDLGKGHYVADVPPHILMDMVKTAMLATFGVTFFILDRSDDLDEVGLDEEVGG